MNGSISLSMNDSTSLGMNGLTVPIRNGSAGITIGAPSAPPHHERMDKKTFAEERLFDSFG